MSRFAFPEFSPRRFFFRPWFAVVARRGFRTPVKEPLSRYSSAESALVARGHRYDARGKKGDGEKVGEREKLGTSTSLRITTVSYMREALELSVQWLIDVSSSNQSVKGVSIADLHCQRKLSECVDWWTFLGINGSREECCEVLSDYLVLWIFETLKIKRFAQGSIGIY